MRVPGKRESKELLEGVAGRRRLVYEKDREISRRETSWAHGLLGQAETAGEVVGAAEHQARAVAGREPDTGVAEESDSRFRPEVGAVSGAG